MATYVRPLAEELERKRALFMDDASFITEVREGRALAPGMDPEAELRTLRLRFDNFRRDFKVRPAPSPACPRSFKQSGCCGPRPTFAHQQCCACGQEWDHQWEVCCALWRSMSPQREDLSGNSELGRAYQETKRSREEKVSALRVS